jgi:hypothetical protein
MLIPMKDEEIARLRLRRQHLIGPPLATPESVVGWLGAVQSQELAVAKWSLARRARGRVTEADVDRLYAEGRILRTHLLRPTWHFVLPADIRWIIQLTAPRIRARMATYDRQLGLTSALVARSQRMLRKALAGGQHLTRQEIADRFARDRLVVDGPRLGQLMMAAELDMVVCSGAPSGKRQTYALFDERVPAAPALDREQALAELTTRYFTSHGPATLKDFLWWSTFTAAEGRRGLELAGKRLRRLVVGERSYWLGEGARSVPSATAGVHLLQGYDEYLVAYTESKFILAPTGIPLAATGERLFLHALVRDGRLVGGWRRLPGMDAVTVQIRLRHPLDTAGRRELEEEVERYRRFLQRPLRLQLVRARA